MPLRVDPTLEGAREPGPLRSALPTLVLTVVVGALLGRFVLVGGGTGPAPTAPGSARATDAVTAAAQLEAQVRTSPDDPELLTRLGVVYITRARQTADPSFYARAGAALGRSAALAPDRPTNLTARGILALALHDFPNALALGSRAGEITPAAAEPLGVVVDAHVELGRYAEAAAAAQEMVDRRPSLASLSRVSYLRELHGDVAGAVSAMTQAVVAGSASPDDIAYVESLLGDLHWATGELDRAEAAYRRATQSVAGFAAAEAGMARIAASRGDLAAAAAGLEAVVSRLPQPAWVALLGDVLAAQGRTADAAVQFDLVRGIEELNRASGVAVDLELARFEADHARDPGADPEVAVALARSALAARPTVFAADTLGWALRQAGRPAEALPHARAAVRLGTADALLWYHLAAVEADLGLRDEARAHLDRALALAPYLTVRDLPAARALAASLGTPG